MRIGKFGYPLGQSQLLLPLQRRSAKFEGLSARVRPTLLVVRPGTIARFGFHHNANRFDPDAIRILGRERSIHGNVFKADRKIRSHTTGQIVQSANPATLERITRTFSTHDMTIKSYASMHLHDMISS